MSSSNSLPTTGLPTKNPSQARPHLGQVFLCQAAGLFGNSIANPLLILAHNGASEGGDNLRIAGHSY
jgi:hypothetical protein